MKMKIVVLFVLIIKPLDAAHCDKQLNYHEFYGYGFDINCQGITAESEQLLENITVYKEMKLVIDNSTLLNAKADLLASVQKIKLLVIRNSTIWFSDDENVFQRLIQLRHLVIERSNFTFNEKSFKSLRYLKELNVNNVNFPNNSKILQNLLALEILKMNKTEFTNLRQIPLCNLTRLKTLHVRENHLRELENYKFLCKGVLGKAKTISFLEEINLSFNDIDKLGTFKGLSNLRSVLLEGNRIQTVENNVFEDVLNVQKIVLKQNQISKIANEAFNNLPKLNYLDLESNQLTKIRLTDKDNLSYLNLGNNNLTFNGLQLWNLTSMRTLILNRNHLEGDSGEYFNQFITLATLDLSNNRIILNDNTIRKLTRLKYFRIHCNNLKDVPAEAFQNQIILKELDLSFNRISNFQGNATFQSLKDLEILNVSYNLLETLDYGILEPLDNLKILDMAGNRLKHFDYASIMTHLPSLALLNIKSNLLSCDLLFQIITYFKSKNISYTINEDFEYEKENVAGIYCKETEDEADATVKRPFLSKTVSVIVVTFILFCVFILAFKYFMESYKKKHENEDVELIMSDNTFL